MADGGRWCCFTVIGIILFSNFSRNVVNKSRKLEHDSKKIMILWYIWYIFCYYRSSIAAISAYVFPFVSGIMKIVNTAPNNVAMGKERIYEL